MRVPWASPFLAYGKSFCVFPSQMYFMTKNLIQTMLFFFSSHLQIVTPCRRVVFCFFLIVDEKREFFFKKN